MTGMIMMLRRAALVLAAAVLLAPAGATASARAAGVSANAAGRSPLPGQGRPLAGQARPLAVLAGGSAAGLAGRSAAVPGRFQPASASFRSARSGVVLGAVGCRPGRSCQVRLAATTDGGARWHFIGAPDVRLRYPVLANGAGSVVFASRRHGWWLQGPRPWYTRDGGAHWRKLALGGNVETIAAAAGTAYALVLPRISGRPAELFRSPAGRSAWTRVRHVTATAGILAVTGRAAWLGGGDHVWATADGARWHRYPFRCRGTRYQLAGIAAASAARVSFLCIDTTSPSTATEGIEVMNSADGGRTLRFAGRHWVTSNGGLIAVPRHSTKLITFATATGFPNWLGYSANGGKTWRRVVSSTASADWNSLSYVSRKVGWVLLCGIRLLRTSDAGRSWHRVSF